MPDYSKKEMEALHAFAERLKAKRIAAGYKSAKELAEKFASRIGVGPGGYWRWEAGKGWPSQAQINTLADIFGSPVSELRDGEQMEMAGAGASEAVFNEHVERLQQMRPNAKVTVTVTYGMAG